MKNNLNRFTNLFLLIAIIILTLTGIYGLFWTSPRWVYDIHRLIAWGMVAAVPWKISISIRSLRRRSQRNPKGKVQLLVSLLLAIVTLVVLGLGFLWKWGLGPTNYPFRQTAISWHWMLALGLLVPLTIHIKQHWRHPQKADFYSRRAVLRLILFSGIGLAGWRVSEEFAKWRQPGGFPRRSSGSRLQGWYTGNNFPLTHNQEAMIEQLDPSTWRLAITGKVVRPGNFTLEELLGRDQHEIDATLDCTSGWYTTQIWKGIFLADLLKEVGQFGSAHLVRLVSVTGDSQILPMNEAHQILLAHSVGDEPLSHLHGFPLRAIVPTRRGWFWVKWLQRVEVLSGS